MTPKEKAKELVDKYLDLDDYNNLNLDLFCDECGMSNDAAKICALIAVNEILKAFYLNTGSDIVGNHVINFAIRNSEYWKEVKQEIEKL